MDTNTKRFYRSQNERMIAGVCGGVAEYFDIDPTLVRLLFVVFALAGGPGLIAYFVMMLIVPENPTQTPYKPAQPATTEQTTIVEDVLIVDENGDEV